MNADVVLRTRGGRRLDVAVKWLLPVLRIMRCGTIGRDECNGDDGVLGVRDEWLFKADVRFSYCAEMF